MATKKPSLFERLMNVVKQPVAGQVADRFQVAVTATTGGSGKLPDPGEPKVKGKEGVAIPTLFDSAKPDTSSALNEDDRQIANLDLTTLRTTSPTKQMVALFARVNPEMSAAVDAYQRLGLTKFSCIAYDRTTNTPSLEATAYLAAFMQYNDRIGNYAAGYVPNIPIALVLQRLGLEMRHFGACSLEVVLNAARQAERFQPIGVRDLKWWAHKSGKYSVPAQDVNGDRIDLDIATFHYVSLDQSLYTAYSDSPLEPAIQAVLMSLQFLNDVRRVIRTAVQPRTMVKLDAEKLMTLAPLEARTSEEKFEEFRSGVVEAITDQINGLEPEEALVYLDIMEVSILSRGNESLSSEYATVESMANGKIAAGAKTLPSVIGHGKSQSTATVESMIFVKQVEGAHQNPLNIIMSKAMTQAARLAGFDIYAEFSLEPVTLRPEIELAGFRAQDQARILEQLSLGLIDDATAWLKLTGKVPSPGSPTLSGTGFYNQKATDVDNGNPYSGTSGPGGDGGGGALNETLKPKTSPAKSGDN